MANSNRTTKPGESGSAPKSRRQSPTPDPTLALHRLRITQDVLYHLRCVAEDFVLQAPELRQLAKRLDLPPMLLEVGSYQPNQGELRELLKWIDSQGVTIESLAYGLGVEG